MKADRPYAYSAIRALASIQEISEKLAVSPRAHDFPYFIVSKVVDVIDVTRCSIVWLAPGHSLGYVIASHDAPDIMNLPIDLHKYPEICAMRDSGQPIIINDIIHSRLLAPCRDSLCQTPYTAIMAIPILLHNRATGALMLRGARKASGFSESEVQFCQTVANLASLSSQHLLACRQMIYQADSESATQPRSGQEYFVTASPQMQNIREIIACLSDIREPVLIYGESGVGKENIARALHANSARSRKPFVKVNCAALPIELLESELFGHERGAFTGAYRQKPGKFELANGGIIFLDEIGELHISLQAKLLHVLQEGQFAKLGGRGDIKVDVWVLAATNKDLEKEVAKGNFRQDLYYRLNVLDIWVPPLRQRRQDIKPLVDHFLYVYNKKYNRAVNRLSERLMALFHQYDWPGNVRQLENVMRKIVVLEDEQPVITELLASVGAKEPLAGDNQVEMSLKEIARKAALEAECEAIRRVLNQTNWNRTKAAQKLGVSYRALQYKVKACGLVRKGL